MIGNDVVDLADADADATTYSPRFDARVFGDDERAWLDASGDAERGRWALWAAKEAAYKALKQTRSQTVFSPAAFAVRWDDAACSTPDQAARWTGVVKGAGDEAPRGAEDGLRVEVDLDAERVHAIAWRDGELAPQFEVARLPEDSGVGDLDPSAFVRRRLVRKLAAALGVPRARVTLDRRARIPVVLLDGQRSPIEVSLSHHGRFVAAAWSPRGVRRARSMVRIDPRRVREVCA